MTLRLPTCDFHDATLRLPVVLAVGNGLRKAGCALQLPPTVVPACPELARHELGHVRRHFQSFLAGHDGLVCHQGKLVRDVHVISVDVQRRHRVAAHAFTLDKARYERLQTEDNRRLLALLGGRVHPSVVGVQGNVVRRG